VFQHSSDLAPKINPFVESFNGKFREYCLDMHEFRALEEARSFGFEEGEPSTPPSGWPRHDYDLDTTPISAR